MTGPSDHALALEAFRDFLDGHPGATGRAMPDGSTEWITDVRGVSLRVDGDYVVVSQSFRDGPAVPWFVVAAEGPHDPRPAHAGCRLAPRVAAANAASYLAKAPRRMTLLVGSHDVTEAVSAGLSVARAQRALWSEALWREPLRLPDDSIAPSSTPLWRYADVLARWLADEPPGAVPTVGEANLAAERIGRLPWPADEAEGRRRNRLRSLVRLATWRTRAACRRPRLDPALPIWLVAQCYGVTEDALSAWAQLPRNARHRGTSPAPDGERTLGAAAALGVLAERGYRWASDILLIPE